MQNKASGLGAKIRKHKYLMLLYIVQISEGECGKNKALVTLMMPNRLKNGNPAYYPSEFIMLNIIQILRYSLIPQANGIIQLHNERLLATLKRRTEWNTM